MQKNRQGKCLAGLLIVCVICSMCVFFACGNSEKEEHTQHEFATDWSYDAYYHWHRQLCDCADVALQKEPHVFNGEVCTVCAYTRECTAGLEYQLNADNQSYSVTGIGSAETTDIVIPSQYRNLPVTGIISLQSPVTTIDMPDSITFISDRAFSNDKLTALTIGNGVTDIGANILSGCSALRSVTVAPNNVKYHSDGNCIIETQSKVLLSGCANSTIPNDGSVTSIGDYAFSVCSKLTSITIPNSVTSIGRYAFYGCSGLTNIAIPNSVTSIGSSAFWGCSSLTSITIPNSVTSIGSSVFYECSGLESVTIPDSVTSIGGTAFYGCRSLTSITIPNSVTSIGGGAFEYCSLTSIEIPNSVTSIGSYAFYGCPIQEATIPALAITTISKNVLQKVIITSGDSIEDFAFTDWDSLTSLSISNSVTSIGRFAFYNCSSLESITVAKGNPKYHSEGNCLIETESKTLLVGCKNSVIPSDGSVTSIGSNAFNGYSSLTSIEIPNSVTSIGYNAFYGCSSLMSITIPDSVTSIGDSAFSGCSSLTSITIPDSVTSIGDIAFHGCSSLTSITIPDSVTSIGDDAFSGCRSLTDIYCEVKVKPSDWSNSWKSYCFATVHWGDSWEYVDGVPTLKE